MGIMGVGGVTPNMIPIRMKYIIDKLLLNEFRKITKDFLIKSKNEIGDYKDVGIIIKRYSTGYPITLNDKIKVRNKLINSMKISGASIIFILPFGSILLYILVVVGKKIGINFLPKWKN